MPLNYIQNKKKKLSHSVCLFFWPTTTYTTVSFFNFLFYFFYHITQFLKSRAKNYHITQLNLQTDIQSAFCKINKQTKTFFTITIQISLLLLLCQSVICEFVYISCCFRLSQFICCFVEFPSLLFWKAAALQTFVRVKNYVN